VDGCRVVVAVVVVVVVSFDLFFLITCSLETKHQ